MVSLHPSRISDPAEFGRFDVLYNLAAKSHFSPIETNSTRAELESAECPTRAPT